MNRLYPFALLLCLLFGCIQNDTITPVTEEDYINKNEDGSIAETSEVDLILDGNSVGRLSLALQRDSLFISYVLNPDIIVTGLKFHVSTSKENLPSADGKLDMVNFQFSKKDLSMPLSKITGSGKYKGPIFFVFFCKVSFTTPINEDEVADAKIRSKHDITDASYFKAFVSTDNSEEEFLAYCLQGDQSMDTSYVHQVKRLCSLTKDKTLLSSTVDAPDNLDLVNWILNQDPSKWVRSDGAPANGADRQMAIWKLIEKTGNPTGVNIAGQFDPATVNKIVNDAKANGNNFRPSCGDKVLYVLHKGPIGEINSKGTFNSGSYANPDYQVTGIVRTIQCHGSELYVWAFGKKYFLEDIGTYFVMYKN